LLDEEGGGQILLEVSLFRPAMDQAKGIRRNWTGRSSPSMGEVSPKATEG
jgi:hypothetical protein